MKKAIAGLIVALAGFGITYLNTTFTNIAGLVLMAGGVVLFFWGLADARRARREKK